MAELDFNALKVCTKCKIAKAPTEFYASTHRPSGKYPSCKVCGDASRAAHHAANIEKETARKAAYRLKNIEHSKSVIAAWAKENSEYVKAYNTAYYKEFAEKIKAYHADRRKKYPGERKEYLANWKKENAPNVNATSAARYTKKIQARPEWADLVAIKGFYKEATAISLSTGIPHHVDHIVPLCSDLVCGLHVPANLQVLTSTENIVKGNRYWPDMP